MAGSEEAPRIGLVVGVSTRGRGVLLDHIHCGGVHRRDDRHVAVRAAGAHPEVSRLRVGGLGDARGVAAAHHVGVVVPDGGDPVLDVHVALSQLDALVGATSGDGATAAAASALVHAVTLGVNTIVTGHNPTTGWCTAAGSQIECTQFVVGINQSFRVGNSGNCESFVIIGNTKRQQYGQNCKSDDGVHFKQSK